MTDTAPLFPSLPAISGKKVSAAFDCGRITSDGGVLLLAATQARGMCERLAALVPDDRDRTRTRHGVTDIFLARSLAIAAGYEDADGAQVGPGQDFNRFGNPENESTNRAVGIRRQESEW